MKIVFKKITINNFLSFGNATIELQDRGFVMVSGINNNPDDSAKSNGSGKSSWGEAIVWCLTGETVRGITKNITNIHTEGGCSVELDFTVDDSSYQVTRYKDHKVMGSNLKITVDGKDISGKGIRDTEKILSEYLPEVTASLIGSVIVLGQGLPQRFSNNTPAGRKEVLEKLSKSDFMIEDIKSKISARKSVMASEVRATEDSLLTLNTQKVTIERNLAELTKLQEELSVTTDFDYEINACEEQLKELNSELSDLDTQKTNYSNKIFTVGQQISIVADKCSFDTTKATEEINEVLLKSREERYELATNISHLQSEIANLESIKDICPTCGQRLPDVHKPDTSKQREQLAILKDNLSSLDDRIVGYSNKSELIRGSIKASADAEIVKLQSEHTYTQGLLREVSSNIVRVSEKIQEFTATLNKIQMDKALYNNRVIDTANSISKCNSQIAEILDKIEYNNSIKELQVARQEIISKMMTIATRDFRGYLLKNVIEYIDTKSKIYCKDIFDTDKLDFSLDGNNINISYDNKMYENLSGGEKQKIDLIIQFSLRDMLCTFTNFSSNILILDEIFDNLDSYGCQRVLNMISKQLSDVDSIFIISHHTDDLSIPYDAEMTIIKNEQGVSTIL